MRMNDKYEENYDIGYLQGRNNNKYTKTTEDKIQQTDKQMTDLYIQ